MDWLGNELPPAFLRVYESGTRENPALGQQENWVARELADETWADTLRHGACTNVADALSAFALAREGVAALHDRQVYRWSAHESSVPASAAESQRA